MITTVNFSEFCDAFRDYDRNENFSYDGKKALFEYLEDYGEDTGKEVELDIVALCCEYTEYENLAAFHKDYDKETYPDIDTLRNHTQVIETENDVFIIQSF